MRLQAAPSRSRPRANERDELPLARTGAYLFFARNFLTPATPAIHTNSLLKVSQLHGAHKQRGVRLGLPDPRGVPGKHIAVRQRARKGAAHRKILQALYAQTARLNR